MKKKMTKIFSIVLFLCIGGICGIFAGIYMAQLTKSGKSVGEICFVLAGIVVCFYFAAFLQTILHEMGHLLFGLLSGYHFSSFRIGSLMLKKEEGHLKFCRLSLAGTGGQCLMVPPDWENGKIPYVLYNLGGSFLNLITAGIFLVLFFLCQQVKWLALFFLMCGLVGVVFALLNGIPMQTGMVDNDGYNVYSLSKDKDALRAFYIQMKINEQLSKGVRPSDMPEEWFVISSEKKPENRLVSVIAVFSCNRMMDAHDFNGAYQKMRELLENQTGIVELYQHLMKIDCIYCELVGENRKEIIEDFVDDILRKFMKSMKNYPSVLRTRYAYALLAKDNEEKAGQIKEAFDKMAKTYPHPCDIESERELMMIAEKKAQERKKAQ